MSKITALQEEIEKYKRLVEKDIIKGNPVIILSDQTNYWNLKHLNECIVELKGRQEERQDIIELLDKLFEELRQFILKQDVNNHNWNPNGIAGFVVNAWLIKKKELSENKS